MLRNSVIMDAATDPENNVTGPPCSGLTCDPSPKSARLSPPSPKRSRRSIQKRVVSIPFQDAAGAAGDGSHAKGVSECAPPSDSWAWRKYGQKPIKGSPYPRGYYRCSSSKGCPARKQVERSRVDPTMLVVTYTCEHSHSRLMPKNHNSSKKKQQHHVAVKDEEEVGPEAEVDPDLDPTTRSPPDSGADPEESRFSDLIGEGSAPMTTTLMPDDFWYSDVGSTSPPSDTLLYGPIFVGSVAELAADECCENIGDFKDDDEDALFAGLGELPEYSTVFRRSYFDRKQQQMAIRTAVHQ